MRLKNKYKSKTTIENECNGDDVFEKYVWSNAYGWSVMLNEEVCLRTGIVRELANQAKQGVL